MPLNKLSAVIITYNEEQNIGRCLHSLKNVADEIIVVDSFSTDATEAICEAFEVTFIKNKFEGHVQQKNWAVKQATNDYVLSLDADEELSKELENSIIKLKKTNSIAFEGYYMNRLTSFCGKWIKHSWYPDKKLRLWNRHKGSWGGDNPHDQFFMNNNIPTGHLKGDLLHYSYHTISEYNIQIEKFSSISSETAYQKGKNTSQLGIYIHALGKFFKKYILKRGFLDGWDGLYIAISSGYYTMLKYRKLYQLQNEKSKK